MAQAEDDAPEGAEWRNAREGDAYSTVLRCPSTDFEEIGKCITAATARLARMTTDLGAPVPGALLVEVDATNGHLMLTWHDDDAETLFVYVELKHLWWESLEHPEGAAHFDRYAHLAICSATENFNYEADGEWRGDDNARYDVFELYQWGDAQEVRV
ncbi:hypothetical protein P1X14_05045 [Sphingomonas sp. AOB5]|uniref:hypothetical protein n=1 Tax=Sphingomonas sp. AOB5 TaxID=3034017 RepID=UPI0023F95A5C|nr:hypothetical protein [Sphingomonas sp. AOB5]MDF7774605.1 hypothetical protein [Sphingomonas sp. AOB5]